MSILELPDVAPETNILAAALEYASRRWPVIPIHTPVTFGPKVGPDRSYCSCRKPDCESQGKHPRTAHGLSDATTDPVIIRRWWHRWPDANIGICTGVAFDALDLDGPDAIDAIDGAALATLKLDPSSTEDLEVLTGPTVITGRGVQIYVLPTGAGNREGMVPAVDWRGAGGYVVAPPSLHYRYGDRYEWGPTAGPETPLKFTPGWLDDLVLKKGRWAEPKVRPGASSVLSGTGGSRYGLRALEGELGRLAVAAEGTRNKMLVISAYRIGRLVAGGELDSLHVIKELLLVAGRIGLADLEAKKTITSGMAAGMANPRAAS